MAEGEAFAWIRYFVDDEFCSAHVLHSNSLVRVLSGSMLDRVHEKFPKRGADVFAFLNGEIFHQFAQERNEPVCKFQLAVKLQCNPLWYGRQDLNVVF